MVRKPASMYRKVKRAFTRRKYMGGVPGSQVIRFDMGNLQVADGFPVTVSLLAMEPCQIRHTALEAARITGNKLLTNIVGNANYHMKLRVYPFQVLRENKQATGAGADRVSSGMRHAFGRAVGTAARVNAGQKVFSISTDPQNFKHAKEALRKIGHKLPTPTSIVVDKGSELLS